MVEVVEKDNVITYRDAISLGLNRIIDPYGSWHWIKGTYTWESYSNMAGVVAFPINVLEKKIIFVIRWLLRVVASTRYERN